MAAAHSLSFNLGGGSRSTDPENLNRGHLIRDTWFDI